MSHLALGSRGAAARRGALALALLLAAATARSAPGQAQPAQGLPRLTVARISPGASPQGPRIRVGLTTDRRKVMITANGPFQILDPSTGLPAWKGTYREEVVVTTHGATMSEARVWRVQAASAPTREAAVAIASRIEAESGEAAVVSFNPDRGSWRVRAGTAPDRAGIVATLQKLRSLGWSDAWVVDEQAPAGPAWLRLVDSEFDTAALDLAAVTIEPIGEALLAVDGRRYRGSLEARVDAGAGLRVINVVPMEQYLRGVVPAELGPSIWPELEAQKAQAVAARTYAVRNLGRFFEEGFDLCDTPRCQLYDGVAAEHPLSDRAVRETSGIVASYGGAPINALFTSTCGGHTEDGGEIFPEEDAPYLRGTSCYPEQETLHHNGAVIEGVAVADAGGPAGEVLAASLLVVAGIARPGDLQQLRRAEPLPEERARALIEAAGGRFGLDGRIGQGRQAATRLGFALALAERLGWQQRAAVLVDPRDLPGLLREPDAALIPESDRRLAGALAQKDLLPASVDGDIRPGAPLALGEALCLLERMGTFYGVPEIVEGTVVRVTASTIKLRRPDRQLALAAPRQLALFQDSGAGPRPLHRQAVYPGDRVRAAADGRGEVGWLVVLPSRRGWSDDRSSPAYSWDVTMTGAELNEKLAARFELGEVRDLVPVRRGVSGRLVALKIVGERGETTLTGFNVRSALGLKESLFAVDRLRGPDGRLQKVAFSGKGWGHGVGMCQVGAYGMAARGAGYRQIIEHYYRGAVLARVY